MSESGRPTLRVRNITHSFGGHRVLDDVDLEIPPARVIGLLGPNGAGKTTLMRIIFGVLPPDEGEVLWGDRPAGERDRRSWGYMPQERGLYRDMRVADHLVWLGRLHGLDRDTAAEHTGTLLERLGLADRSTDPIKDLSGGMTQRVQLAAAMVHEPDLLVLDEPFAGLDPGAVSFLSGVIHDQLERGGNLILSSHQLDLVEDICESIVLIHEGRVVLRGEVARLKAQSADRYLRVGVVVEPGWFTDAGVQVVARDASGSRISLSPTTDPGVVLDQIRARTDVHDFAVEAPSLSELFLAATGSTATGPVAAQSSAGQPIVPANP